ncbi:hypothetical protein PoB_005950600 [Plakobranchus ocellatus]|uniref:Uncharacterized protein n=1 Tax=Plakobranchus ocellatus TaxID=259542 RepID=A0AAV4CMB8_9GAST|nr:hypothetical protein PoB_005950600 [Plakobranchus ocellatus]
MSHFYKRLTFFPNVILFLRLFGPLSRRILLGFGETLGWAERGHFCRHPWEAMLANRFDDVATGRIFYVSTSGGRLQLGFKI